MKNCFVNFYSSLKIINNISEIEKMGISDTALTNIFEIEFSIENLYIFNDLGFDILFKNFTKNSGDNIFLTKRKFLIKKIFLNNKINVGEFKTLIIGNRKIMCYYNIFFFCIISHKLVLNSLLKFFLEFICVAFTNFIGESCENYLFNISKIFEIFFLKILYNKFKNIIKFLSSDQNDFQEKTIQIKLKNILVIDMKKKNILLNIKKLLTKKKEKIRNYFNNEIIKNFLFKNLSENQNNNFLSNKIELFSTFPRLSFISKYYKIYNGLAIIEIFSSNRLSRTHNKYFEYELKYFNNKTEEEKMYSLINDVEILVKNYFISFYNKFSIFNDMKGDLLYFNKDFLNLIFNSLNSRMSFDYLINFLIKKIIIFFKKSSFNKIHSNFSTISINTNNKNKSNSNINPIFNNHDNNNIFISQNNSKNNNNSYNNEYNKSKFEKILCVSRNDIKNDLSFLFFTKTNLLSNIKKNYLISQKNPNTYVVKSDNYLSKNSFGQSFLSKSLQSLKSIQSKENMKIEDIENISNIDKIEDKNSEFYNENFLEEINGLNSGRKEKSINDFLNNNNNEIDNNNIFTKSDVNGNFNNNNQNICNNKYDIIKNIQHKLEYFGENGANNIKKTKTLSFYLKNNYENLMNQNVIEDDYNYKNINKNNTNNNNYYNHNNFYKHNDNDFNDVNNVNNLNNYYGNMEDKDKSNIEMLPPTSPTFARLNKKK